MTPTEIILGGAVTLLTGERGLQWFRAWQASRRAERADAEERDGKITSEVWALYRKATEERDQAIAECRRLEAELSDARRAGDSAGDACQRCLDRLAEEQGRAAGLIRRVEELEELLAEEQKRSKEERTRAALLLAEALDRQIQPSAPEPRSLADDFDVPDPQET